MLPSGYIQYQHDGLALGDNFAAVLAAILNCLSSEKSDP